MGVAAEILVICGRGETGGGPGLEEGKGRVYSGTASLPAVIRVHAFPRAARSLKRTGPGVKTNFSAGHLRL